MAKNNRDRLRERCILRYEVWAVRRLEAEHREMHRIKNNQWLRPGKKFYRWLLKNPDFVTAQKVKWLLTDKAPPVKEPGRSVPPHRSGGVQIMTTPRSPGKSWVEKFYLDSTT